MISIGRFVVCQGGKAHSRQHKAGCQAGGGHGYRNILLQMKPLQLVKKVSVSEGGFPYRLRVKSRQMQREGECCTDFTAWVYYTCKLMVKTGEVTIIISSNYA